MDEQKSVDLFESLCFWDKQVGGFPQSENLEPSSFGRNVKRWGGSHLCLIDSQLWLLYRVTLP